MVYFFNIGHFFLKMGPIFKLLCLFQLFFVDIFSLWFFVFFSHSSLLQNSSISGLISKSGVERIILISNLTISWVVWVGRHCYYHHYHHNHHHHHHHHHEEMKMSSGLTIIWVVWVGRHRPIRDPTKLCLTPTNAPLTIKLPAAHMFIVIMMMMMLNKVVKMILMTFWLFSRWNDKIIPTKLCVDTLLLQRTQTIQLPAEGFWRAIWLWCWWHHVSDDDILLVILTSSAFIKESL